MSPHNGQLLPRGTVEGTDSIRIKTPPLVPPLSVIEEVVPTDSYGDHEHSLSLRYEEPTTPLCHTDRREEIFSPFFFSDGTMSMALLEPRPFNIGLIFVSEIRLVVIADHSRD